MEKQAQGGASSFLEALSGSKRNALRKEVKSLEKEITEKSKHPALNDTYNNYKKIEESVGNSSIHPRMQEVKQTLEDARKDYQQSAKENDSTFNKFVGLRKPLALLHPFEYGGAKLDMTTKKMALNDAKARYKSQEKRIRNDIKEELESAKEKYEDAKRAAGVHGAIESYNAKSNELAKAEAATRSARTVTGVGAAGVAGAAYYKHKKDNPGTGPYTYDQIDPYKTAGEADETVDKIATEILQCMIQK
jgi:hypothetical protein